MCLLIWLMVPLNVRVINVLAHLPANILEDHVLYVGFKVRARFICTSLETKWAPKGTHLYVPGENSKIAYQRLEQCHLPSASENGTNN